jgi:hypothetical protein
MVSINNFNRYKKYVLNFVSTILSNQHKKYIFFKMTDIKIDYFK